MTTVPTPKDFRIVDESELPLVKNRTRDEWLALFSQIPSGKALVTSEKDLGVTVGSIHELVTHYVKKGLIPSGFKVHRRTEGGKVTIYIVHSAKENKSISLEGKKK